MIGSLLNQRYRIDASLGKGGMGIVYRAHDTLLDRDVAVKLVSDAGLGSEGRARLLNEARAAAQLNHPNIVTVYDAGEMDNTPFIVMELIEGDSLDERPPASLDELYRVARQICAALEEAHSHGVIHRDLKPENVLVTRSGTAKLTDFGLALSLASRMTSEGTIIGTVFYMSPEMMLGQPVDGRADLYALGVMLYELAAGRLPFIADNPLGVISQHIHAPVVPPGAYRPDLPVALENIILRLLAKDPNDRYPDARAVRLALADAKAAGEQAETLLAGSGVTGYGADGVDDLLEKLARGRLVGRQAEMGQLNRLWKNAQLGQAQLALISGEPGVGKTRLANELIVYARLAGALVLRGGCYEYEATTPYLPFIEALRDWVRLLSTEELARQVEGLACELAKLAPEIATRLGPLTPNAALAPAEERLRLFDHVARLLERLAQERGLVLFIDDIHWADLSSLGLLNYLMRHLRSSRLMILACYREVELDRSHPFAATLAEWIHTRLAVRLSLGRLSEEAVGQLLSALFGVQSLSDEFTQAVYRETEGNPFFVEEVIKSLIEQGQIYREDGRWQRGEIADLAIPQSIKEAVGRRLDRQSPACVDLLHTAAALGKRFDFQELVAVSGQGENELLDWLDEASCAQLVRPESSGRANRDSYVFTHDKIREVLYEELNPIRRRRLHLRIGEGLERLYELTPDAEGEAAEAARSCNRCVTGIQTLAYHFIEGGELEKGLGYSIQAAQKARQVFALDDACIYYEHAIECAEALGQAKRQSELYAALGDLHIQRGSYQEAVATLNKALALCDTPAQQARLKTQLGMSYAQVGDERGIAYLEAAIPELDPQTQPGLLSMAYAQLSRFYHYRMEAQRAIDLLEKARQLVEPLEDYVALTSIYAYLSGVYQQASDFETSMEWARRTLALGKQYNYLFAVAMGYEFLAEDLYATRQWRKSLAYAQLDKHIGQKIGSQSRLAWGLSAEAHAYNGLGELAQALQTASECIAIVQHTDEKRLEVQVRSLRSQIYLLMGDPEAAAVDLDFICGYAAANPQAQILAWTYGARVMKHMVSNEWEQVLAVSEECDRVRGYRLAGPEILALRTLDRRDGIEGWRRVLEQDSETGAALTGTVACGELDPEVCWIYGLILDYLGEREQAASYLDRAVTGYQAEESRLMQGQVLYLRACFYRDGGDWQAAHRDAEQALTLLNACGAKLFAEKTQQLLAQQG